MLDFLRSPLAIIFVFGVVVFVHELGHFLAAKWVGVYAPRFSIGFGPRLWSRKWGETEYIIAAIPLGGYVRMASREDEPAAFLEGGGETPVRPAGAAPGAGGAAAPDSAAPRPRRRPRYWDPNAIAPFGPLPVPEHRLFESKSLAARLFIMLAGVTMNVLLGLVVLTGIYLTYGEEIVPTRVVGTVRAMQGAPQLAQIAHGDTVIAVDGQPVTSWDDVQRAIVRGSGDTVRIRTQRTEVAVPVGGSGGVPRLRVATALSPMIPPVIGRVFPGRPARRSGLRAGDSVVAIGDRPVRSWTEMVDIVASSPGRPLRIEYRRDGRSGAVTVTPEPTDETDPLSAAVRTVGKIGAQPQRFVGHRPVPLGTALEYGWRESVFYVVGVASALRDLVTGTASPRELGGVITIASESAEAAKLGFESLRRFLALISVNLAVFNLLPIPILDGGQIVLNIAEAVRGRAFSERTRQYIAYVGLSAILLLVVFALFNDVTRQIR